MEIEKNYAILKACRFCPMCRHLCTSGNLTGRESDFPRGRGLIMYDVYRGAKYSSSYANALYNCVMCGSCLGGCEGGFDLPELIRASRVDMTNEGLEPEYARTLKDNLLKSGNLYGKNIDESYTYKNNAFEKKDAEVIYILGQNINFYHAEIARAATGVLEELKADFTLIPKESSCGEVLGLLGYEKDAINMAKKFQNEIKKYKNIKTLITSDPIVYDCIVNNFSKWSINIGVELKKSVKVMHFSDFAEKIIKEKKVSLKKYLQKTAIVDSEYLCKKNSNCQASRNIAAMVSGDYFIEFARNKKDAFATGEAAFYYDYGPFTKGQNLAGRICDEAERLKIEVLVTLSGIAKENLNKCECKNFEIMDIAEFVLKSIKG